MFLYEEVIPLDENGNFLCYTRPHAGFESDEYREIKHAYAWAGNLKTRVMHDVFPLLSMPIPADLELAKMLLQGGTLQKAKVSGAELTAQQKESVEKALFRARLLSKPSRAIPEMILPAKNGLVLTICRNKTQVKGEIRHRFLMRLIDLKNKSVVEQLDIEGEDSVLEKIKAVGSPLAINPSGDRALFWSNGNLYVADTHSQFKAVSGPINDFSSKCATWCNGNWVATRTNVKKGSSVLFVLNEEKGDIQKEYFAEGIVVNLHAAGDKVLALMQDGKTKILNIKTGEIEDFWPHKEVPRTANVMGSLSANGQLIASWTDSEHKLMVTDTENVTIKKYFDLNEVKSLIHKGKNGEIHKVMKPTCTFIGNYLVSISQGRLTYIKDETTAKVVNLKFIKAPNAKSDAKPAQDLDSKLKRNLSLEEMSQTLTGDSTSQESASKTSGSEIDTGKLSLVEEGAENQAPAENIATSEKQQEAVAQPSTLSLVDENQESTQDSLSEDSLVTQAEPAAENSVNDSLTEDLTAVEVKPLPETPAQDSLSEDLSTVEVEALAEEPVKSEGPVNDSLSEDLTSVEVEPLPETPAPEAQDSLTEDLSTIEVEPVSEDQGEPQVDSLMEDLTAVEVEALPEVPDQETEDSNLEMASLGEEAVEMSDSQVDDSLTEDLGTIEVEALPETPVQEVTDPVIENDHTTMDLEALGEEAEGSSDSQVNDSATEDPGAIEVETLAATPAEEWQDNNETSQELQAMGDQEDIQDDSTVQEYGEEDLITQVEDEVSGLSELQGEYVEEAKKEYETHVDESLLDQLNDLLGVSSAKEEEGHELTDETTGEDSTDLDVPEAQETAEILESPPQEDEVSQSDVTEAEEVESSTDEEIQMQEIIEEIEDEHEPEAGMMQELLDAQEAQPDSLVSDDIHEAGMESDNEHEIHATLQEESSKGRGIEEAEGFDLSASQNLEIDYGDSDAEINLQDVELDDGPRIGMSYENEIPDDAYTIEMDGIQIDDEEMDMQIPDEGDTDDVSLDYDQIEIDDPGYSLDQSNDDNLESIIGEFHQGDSEISGSGYNHQQGLMANLAEFDLVSAKEIIADYYTQAVAMKLSPVELILPVGSSKVGGNPDLPDNMEWPQYNELPMSFIAQINLDQLSQVDPDHPLPKNGLLSFFIGINPEYHMPLPSHAEEPMWRVIHLQHVDELVSTETPDFPETVINARFEECEISLELQAEGLPDTNSIFFETMGLNEQQQTLYMGLFQAMETARVDRKQAGHELHHKLLGYPEYINLNNMEMQCTKAFDEGLSKEEMRNMAQDWMMLMQLDSDEQESDFFWGHGGMLYWFIRKSDLAKGSFDNTWIIIQQ